MEFLLRLCDSFGVASKRLLLFRLKHLEDVLSSPVSEGTETRWQAGLGFDCSYLHGGLSMVPASYGY